MGKIVDEREEIPFPELLLLLQSGYTVSHETGSLAIMFTKAMSREQAFVAWAGCAGGRFIAREAGPSPKTAN